MTYVLGILISIAILNAQIWLVSEIFPGTQYKKHKRRVLLMSIGMGALVASLLWVYGKYAAPYIATRGQGVPPVPVNAQPMGTYPAPDPNRAYARTYSVFILIAGSFITLLFARRRARWGMFIAGAATIVGSITGGVQWLLAGSGIAAAISPLIMKATGEEILKSAGAQTLPTTRTTYTHDIVVMSIIAGLGFALCENIIYFLSSGGSRGLLLTRSITTSLLHAIFTGCIGYIISIRTIASTSNDHQKPSFTTFLIAFTIGIALHITYNLSMQYVPMIGGIVFVIGGYGVLSYILYSSDRLYYT